MAVAGDVQHELVVAFASHFKAEGCVVRPAPLWIFEFAGGGGPERGGAILFCEAGPELIEVLWDAGGGSGLVRAEQRERGYGEGEEETVSSGEHDESLMPVRISNEDTS